MALIQVGADTYIDTDDLPQAEYHYFRKAESLGYHRVAIAILEGRVTAEDIESDPYYSWLVTKEDNHG